ncbi:MAG: peptidoglycan-binding domain-containing protein [Bacteroidota bacterium]
MKNLFYLVVAICLPLLAWFKFIEYRRFHPPADYTYTPKAEIDAFYHDPDQVLRYYQLAEEIENHARYAWAEDRVDVKAEAPDDPEGYVRTYQQMLATARHLEGKLLQSAKWKSQGYNDQQVKELEKGTHPDEWEAKSLLDNPIVCTLQQQNALVFDIQKMLSKLGYVHPVDGIYRQETYASVKTFQEKAGLYPSGIVDKKTLLSLMKASKKEQSTN